MTAPAWQAHPVDRPDCSCFRPWRRSVSYRTAAEEVAINDLRGELALTSTPNWGMILRRGLIQLTEHDHAVIAAAMSGE
ncbi:hypothetical protein NONI108955_13315 [Nocardia ninae]|uniref:EVE domain-containing protein n=1 Tax=Nocardia ninae NBRC 108245 TaxID=1210091 RepID=A0A511MC32_9NOCA|nr:hypothetical protein [Nocardia ninae]GEM37747.1 hypothetical protein NN4_22660 [Nocardia ninae NBRC 108245]